MDSTFFNGSDKKVFDDRLSCKFITDARSDENTE